MLQCRILLEEGSFGRGEGESVDIQLQPLPLSFPTLPSLNNSVIVTRDKHGNGVYVYASTPPRNECQASKPFSSTFPTMSVRQ